ncbi:MAG: hypothetical protein Faunusvirus52_8 [Faunusvirus sp.]|jgi:hypothetical protein|uniref:Uncharacterized protein n=1 Tax=Faunusvirus sp. TaxID=2487766 RepID=A0A3G5A0L3_9VIRU|nr:MAG: hypothetical protein Faunusvirus52_8 [Faunusvirus sp.]
MTNIFKDIVISPLNKNQFAINENQIVDSSHTKMRKYVLKTPVVTVPFGTEIYKNKHIINIELSAYKTDIIMKKFAELLHDIDIFFGNLKELHLGDDVVSLKNKEYYPCIKMRPNSFDPLVRVHIKERKNITLTEIAKNDVLKDLTSAPATLADIKRYSKMVIYIEIASIWVHKTTYGVYLDAKKIFIS